ncbi:MAG TPA: nuclear transport factor 2 family protein [Gammaproteobacteria bacterium]
MRETLLLLFSLLPFAAHADDARTLLDLEQRWAAAAAARDHAALDAILADDFTDVSWQGKLRSKADALAAPAAPVRMRQTLSELKVRVYGDTAVVTGLNMAAAVDGSFTTRIRFTDVFIRHAGTWRAVSAQETPERAP